MSFANSVNMMGWTTMALQSLDIRYHSLDSESFVVVELLLDVYCTEMRNGHEIARYTAT